MQTTTTAKKVVLIPFVCPRCAGANAVQLIALSRAGGLDCKVCDKWLRADEIMRAMHSPREVRAADAAPIRVHATKPTSKGGITWPPTAESRAAATPLRKRSQAGR